MQGTIVERDMNRKLLTVGVAILAGLVVCVGIFSPKLYSLYKAYQEEVRQVQLAKLISSAADLYSDGDFEGARLLYEKAAQESMNMRERAQFELLIATTYEKTDLMRCAQLYNSVMVNPSYPDDIRARAGTYLLVAMANSYNPALAEKVFSEEPWTGYVSKESPSPGMNYQISLTKGHEWVVDTSPNFLSLLSAGSFYASLYPYVDEEKRKSVEEKLLPYFTAGSQELATELTKTNWHPNLLAMGNLMQAVYAEDLQKISKIKPIAEMKVVAPSETAIEAMYDNARVYAEAHVGKEVLPIMTFNIQVAHAHFLLSLSRKDERRLAQFGDSIATLINEDLVSAGTAEVLGKAPTFTHTRYRATLITLASLYSPALKSALLGRTTSFTQKDFLAK